MFPDLNDAAHTHLKHFGLFSLLLVGPAAIVLSRFIVRWIMPSVATNYQWPCSLVLATGSYLFVYVLGLIGCRYPSLDSGTGYTLAGMLFLATSIILKSRFFAGWGRAVSGLFLETAILFPLWIVLSGTFLRLAYWAIPPQ